MGNIIVANFELRFKPDPQLLDQRGKITNIVSNAFSFKDWGIGKDSITFLNKEKNEKASVGFKNIGYFMENPSSTSEFPKKVIDFIKTFKNAINNSGNIHVMRLGVRYQFFIDLGCNFDDSVNMVKTALINPSVSGGLGESTNIIDIGVNIDCEDTSGKFNIKSGPMKKEQAPQYLSVSDKEILPDVGFYFDIDYFTDENRLMTIGQASEIINDFSHLCYERKSFYCDKLIKE